jgi:hypothetical protein
MASGPPADFYQATTNVVKKFAGQSFHVIFLLGGVLLFWYSADRKLG